MKQVSIRAKMWTAVGMLLLLALFLAGAAFYAVNLNKNLVRDVAWRANILPVAGTLSRHVGLLQTQLGELRGIRRTRLSPAPFDRAADRVNLQREFQRNLDEVKKVYNEYRSLLEERIEEVGVDDAFEQELSTIHEIRRSVQLISDTIEQPNWGQDKLEAVESQLEQLQLLTNKLPTYLHEELQGYSQSMKRRARWVNGIVLVCFLISFILIALLLRLSYVWIFRPLGVLIDGSRKVAEGTFQYRIQLQSHDEMAELAEAMNGMTERFETVRADLAQKVGQLEEIRRELDDKVREKSRELVRSERLASVGFLAAGVAHEINNPLMAISTCSESLQRRALGVFEKAGADSDETNSVLRYLKMIQDEAFRCKEITQKLLSFARSEKKAREKTDLSVIVRDIVEVTRQHDSFKDKEIRVDVPDSLFVTVNPQEMKQVVLNLVANALQSAGDDGLVTVCLCRDGDVARLTVADNGVGMDEAILKDIFEPFFTQREQGQGTGLGLSITHRIVEDHRGRIEAHSAGPGRGSTFIVEIPVGVNE